MLSWNVQVDKVCFICFFFKFFFPIVSCLLKTSSIGLTLSAQDVLNQFQLCVRNPCAQKRKLSIDRLLSKNIYKIIRSWLATLRTGGLRCTISPVVLKHIPSHKHNNVAWHLLSTTFPVNLEKFEQNDNFPRLVELESDGSSLNLLSSHWDIYCTRQSYVWL